MTVTTTTNKERTVANGTQTDFTFLFKIFASSDLKVYRVLRSTGVATLQTETTHYSVAINTGSEGGTVTFVSAPPATDDVLLLREVPFSQPTDIPSVGQITQPQIEDTFDKVVMQIQQLDERIDRNLTVSIGDTAIDTIVPTLVEGATLTVVSGALAWTTQVVDAGAVPGAANPGDDGKFLKANTGAWSWQLIVLADISDASAFGRTFMALADASAARTNLSVTPALFIPGYRHGIDISQGTTPTIDLDFSAGMWMDDTDTIQMVLSSALTNKKVNASWAVGSGQGLLDGTETVAGTPDANTWYYLWLIRRSDTGVVDVLMSESATTPTMPTSYDQKRRFRWAIRINASNQILDFRIANDTMWYTDTVVDLSENSPTDEADTARTITVPPLSVNAIVRTWVQDTSPSGTIDVVVYSTLDDNQTASGTNSTITDTSGATLMVQADTSSQIRTYYKGVTGASKTLHIITLGYQQLPEL